MAANSYGVVVNQDNTVFKVWSLFSGNNSHLALLDAGVCRDNLRPGDVVQARWEENVMRIRRSRPYPDSIWTDGRRVVVRTIVSFDKEITIARGNWKDETTGLSSVLVISRDIGLVVAPIPWYNREFVDTKECDIFAYAQFLPQSLINTKSHDHVDFYWTIVEDRVSLPATPTKHEHPEKFLEPDEIRNVPALTIRRQGSSMFVWSYALGDHLAVIMTDEKSMPGQWMMVTVIRSSTLNFPTLGCTFVVPGSTVVPAVPYSQPEVNVTKDDAIHMSLALNRSEPDADDSGARLKLWHDSWGLPIGFDDTAADWIRGEKRQFRAIVEIRVSNNNNDEVDGRRVTIRAIAPAAAPRVPTSPAHSRPGSPTFEDLDALKRAIQEADWKTCDYDNNNKAHPGWPKQRVDQTTSTGQWSDGHQKTRNPTEFKATAQQTIPKREESKWENWGREGEKEGSGKTWTKEDVKDGSTVFRPQSMPKREETTWQKWAREGEQEKDSGKTWTKDDGRDGSTVFRPQSMSGVGGATARVTGGDWRGRDACGGGKGNAGSPFVGFGLSQQQQEKPKSAEKCGDGGKKGSFVGFGLSQQQQEKPKSVEKCGDGGKKGPFVGFGLSQQQQEKPKSVEKCGDGEKKGFTGFGLSQQQQEKEKSVEKCSDGGKKGFTGMGNAQQQQENAEKCGDGGKKGFVPILQPNAGKSSSKGGFGSDVIPIRAFNDKQTERAWREEMKGRGWEWPPEQEQIVFPEGNDGWESMGSTPYGRQTPTVKPPIPVHHLVTNPYFMKNAIKAKKRQCLITKVRYGVKWSEADRIQLYVLNGDPAFVVHKMGNERGNNRSYIKNLPEFTTVGNIVELHIGRHSEGWYVNDEMWRLVKKAELPMREAVNEQMMVKKLELIVNAKCLSPWEMQGRHTGRQRCGESDVVVLNDDTVNDICYYGKSIDPREHEDYTYQVVVVPEECSAENAFWKATEVLWRVKKESLFEQFVPPVEEAPTVAERNDWPALKGYKSAMFKPANSMLQKPVARMPVTLPRESRMDGLIAIYRKLTENDSLMQQLQARTGTDYKTLFRNQMDAAESSAPQQTALKKELQANADFLSTIVQNAVLEETFLNAREWPLWKQLQKASDSVKAFRCVSNHR